MGALGLVELQGVGERFQNGLGGTTKVAAFELGVVLDAHPGKHGDLGPAQARDAALVAEGRDAGLFRRDAGAARGEEVTDLGSGVHAYHGTAASALLGGTASTPDDSDSHLHVRGGVLDPSPHAVDRKVDMSVTVQQPVGPARPAVAAPARPPRPGAALAVAMIGFALVTLDAQATNVALPAIHRGRSRTRRSRRW